MSELVEKVAQAIRNCSSQRDADDWERIKEIDRAFWRSFATVSITTIRDHLLTLHRDGVGDMWDALTELDEELK